MLDGHNGCEPACLNALGSLMAAHEADVQSGVGDNDGMHIPPSSASESAGIPVAVYWDSTLPRY